MRLRNFPLSFLYETLQRTALTEKARGKTEK